MEIREYRVPERPGEALCDPPLAQWEHTAAMNRAQARLWTFSVLGMPAGELRQQVRRRLWGRSDGATLIVTGHQPVFFHGGVWIKALAVRRAVAAIPGAAGYHVNVDSDEVPDLGLWLPCGDLGPDGRITVSRRWLSLGSPSTLPLERRPLPTREEWDAFARAGEETLATLPPGPEREGLLERWRRFMAIGRRERDRIEREGLVRSIARFMARARRALESALGDPDAEPGHPRPREPFLGETYVSVVAETPEFHRFTLAWMADAERLAGVYNDRLATYRRLRRYRSQANPFPNLRRYGEQIEIPFWCRGPGDDRADLFVVPAGKGRVVLRTRHGELTRLDLDEPEAAMDALARAGLGIRPKAVPLTMFMRLFASDVFVHGVGGGRYDHITDGVIRGWFGVEPPRYAVVSASLPLELPPLPDEGNDASGEPAVAAAKGSGGHGGGRTPTCWKQLLRALTFNPQRFVPSGGGGGETAGADAELQTLKEEKERLIQAIGEPGAPKRELTRRIEAVNAALSARLEEVRQSLTAGLEAAERREREEAAALARDYPFFLHPWETLWRALDGAAGDAERATWKGGRGIDEKS